MKKIIALVLTVALACMMLTGCGTKNTSFQIALITDKGNIDDKSFNQGSWEGVEAFCKANKIKDYQYIKPEDTSDTGYLAAIDNAVTAGAKVIVTPGYLFEVPVYTAQTKYPEVKFILLDGAPHTADYVYETKSNVASIMYAEEQSGYLAGYAAVKDGYTKLGFMGGMAVPAVQAFGYGYLQGVEAAATELGLADGAITVTYHYTGDFAETDTNKAMAKTMYQEGTQVIFACGGSVGKSVMSAANEADAKVIGVDVDQRYDSTTVITSATKGLGASVQAVLESIYNTNSWDTYAGKTTYFDASNNGVGLPTVVIGDEKANAFDRFNSFDKAAYDEVYATLASGSIDLKRTLEVADPNGIATAEELTTGLNLKKVAVTVR
ncbi:MAG TPA: BMP family ABC transporter substrate-binding protein [Clostridiales bacterium]|nr:BMP family ABC transporter substrate-binding protein [Clostridiales bacterium]